MKKIIKNMLIGYTIGVTILFFTYILGEILGEILADNPSIEYIGITLMLLLHTVVFGICIGMGITIGEKRKEKLKDDVNAKVKILRDMITSILIITMFVAIVLTIFIIKRLDFRIIIITALSIVALGMWGIGAYLAYKSIKNKDKNIKE